MHTFIRAEASAVCELKYIRKMSSSGLRKMYLTRIIMLFFFICVLIEVVNFENKRCSDKLEKIRISHGSCNLDFSPVASLSIIN